MAPLIRRRRAPRHAQGLEVGVRTDGSPLVLPRPSGDPTHHLISGLTGSGKSIFQRALLGALAPLENVAILGADPKRTGLVAWDARMTALAVTPQRSTELFVRLWLEVFRRFDVMTTAGVDEWTPDLGGPFVVLFIDELVEVVAIDGARVADEVAAFLVDHPTGSSADFKSHTDQLKRELAGAKTMREAQGVFVGSLIRVCRSSGCLVSAATQYPEIGALDTQVRANLGLRVMFRVASDEQVDVCLGQGARAQGITARSISPTEPGGCWIEGLEGRPVRARGFYVTAAEARARAAETAHLRWPPGEVFVGQDVTDPMFGPTLHAVPDPDPPVDDENDEDPPSTGPIFGGGGLT